MRLFPIQTTDRLGSARGDIPLGISPSHILLRPGLSDLSNVVLSRGGDALTV